MVEVLGVGPRIASVLICGRFRGARPPLIDHLEKDLSLAPGSRWELVLGPHERFLSLRPMKGTLWNCKLGFYHHCQC